MARPAGRLCVGRPKHFIQRVDVYNILLSSEKGRCGSCFAMLCLAAYTFLLRVPSEALPMQRGSASGECNEGQSVLVLEGDCHLVLRLKSRKNRPQGAVLRRSCTCVGRQDKLCPVHVLWREFFEPLAAGAQPWRHFSPRDVNLQIREVLRILQVCQATQRTGAGPLPDNRVCVGTRLYVLQNA